MEETEAEEADLDSGNEFKATPRRRCVSWTTTLTTWTLGPRNTTDDDRVVRYDPEGPRRARMAMTVWSFVPIREALEEEACVYVGVYVGVYSTTNGCKNSTLGRCQAGPSRLPSLRPPERAAWHP